MTDSSRFLTEVVVVGAGPAGSLCAALLARRGHAVVLINQQRPRSWFELLSPEATLFLERFGFSRDNLAAVARPCNGIVDTWNRARPEYTDFQLMRCSGGWIIERAGFDELLRNFAAQNGAQVLITQQPVRLVSSPFHSVLELQVPGHAHNLQSEFIVDATGVASRFMPSRFSRRLRFDRLVAVHISLTKLAESKDWMRLASASDGWWYVFSPRHQSSQAVFMTDGDLLPKEHELIASHLRSQFQEAFPSEIELDASKVLMQTIEIRDARTTCRHRLWTGRWLPIGDSAFSIDPLSGSGIIRAFDMAESAAGLVSGFLASGCFDQIQATAMERANRFFRTMTELRNYYSGARENNLYLNRPFWQRRTEGITFQCPI